ncbi:MAG: hypothetical protein CMJ23_07950 [Phycisphaerae bacterium]|nr:hypothetical protein [Phycisphaerae bacterium]
MDALVNKVGSPVVILTAVLASMTSTRSATAQDDPPNPKETPAVDPFDPGATETADVRWRGLQHLERIQFLSNISTLNDSPALLPIRPWDPSVDLKTRRPDPLGRPPVDPLFGAPLEPVLRPWRAVQSAAIEQLGLNTSAYYTLLYQHVTDPKPDTPSNFGTGRLDVNLVWNLWEDHDEGGSLLGSGFEGHGVLGILVRQGNQIGNPQSVSTQDSAGSIVGLDSLYSGANGGPATLNLLYLQQGWFDDRFVVSAGKIHPNQYIGLNFWANDESRQFIAGAFDGIQPLGSSQGGYQLGVAVQAIPTESIFVNAVVTDALGRPDNAFSTLGEGFLWTAVETGFVLPFDEAALGGPTVATVIWSGQNLDALASTPTRNWSNAIGFQWQGHLTDQLGYFAQGGWSDPSMSTVTTSISCGIGIERPFGRRGDLFGFGYNWMRPSPSVASGGNGSSLLGADSIPVRYVGLAYNENNVFAAAASPASPQSMIEAFYRVQLTESMQLTPDLQVVFHPGARSDTEVSVVLGLRLTTDF